jgi:methionine synthase I (cobalamin-dependent)
MYKERWERIGQGEVIILDGAVGMQLQGLGAPIGVTAWAGIAQHSHPDTLRFMHETFIEAGVDIITTNTYSSARHCLEPLGLGDLTRELNLRALVLAQEARDRKAKE